jgi:hypothetical protein
MYAFSNALSCSMPNVRPQFLGAKRVASPMLYCFHELGKGNAQQRSISSTTRNVRNAAFPEAGDKKNGPDRKHSGLGREQSSSTSRN